MISSLPRALNCGAERAVIPFDAARQTAFPLSPHETLPSPEALEIHIALPQATGMPYRELSPPQRECSATQPLLSRTSTHQRDFEGLQQHPILRCLCSAARRTSQADLEKTDT